MSQPAPTGDGVPILPLVIADLEARAAVGLATYGTPLRAGNGRDALRDKYEELADALCYARQDMIEREWETEQLIRLRALLAGLASVDPAATAESVALLNLVLARRNAAGAE